LVVIDLQAQENSQEIFETLNARGTPLTAADLVKNFIFQRLQSDGVDTQHAYANDWPFEHPFWESKLAAGRYSITRSSQFLNQWLTSRVGEEISPRSTFTRFKHHVEHEAGQKMHDLLTTLKAQADQYREWTAAADEPDKALTPTEMAVYRMHAAKVEVLKPVLLWVHDPDLAIPGPVADDVIAATESWVIRRQLLRLPTGDLGRVVADLIRTHRAAPTDELPERVRQHLTHLTSSSTYWPGDDEIRNALLTENAFNRFPRPRLRMLLEAVEDNYRAGHNYPPTPRRGFHVEHVMPQRWETNWHVSGLEAELERGAHIHRLGNLTLLTASLNIDVSNGPWEAKRLKFSEFDTFLMNRSFPADAPWDESLIDARTHTMVDAILATWPVPPGHAGNVTDQTAQDHTWVQLKHLIAAGLLSPGTTLTARPGQWEATQAVVCPDGTLQIGDKHFDTPSGAGKHVKGAATNGWSFWRLDDGRKLAHIRAIYQGGRPDREGGRKPFDWTTLHTILEALPQGRWTTYRELADAVGTAPQPLGGHIASCAQCANAHRVLTADGRIADGFAWPDPNDHRDPGEVIRAEGVTFSDGRADLDLRLDSDALGELMAST